MTRAFVEHGVFPYLSIFSVNTGYRFVHFKCDEGWMDVVSGWCIVQE